MAVGFSLFENSLTCNEYASETTIKRYLKKEQKAHDRVENNHNGKKRHF
jgi:hypothetical protein